MFNILRFILISFALIFLLTACQKKISVEKNWQPDIGPQTFYKDPLIERSNAPVWIMPTNAPKSPLKAAFFPFEFNMKYDNRDRISKQLSKTFCKTWVGQKVFPALQFVENISWHGKEAALDQAQKMNADLLISGEITDFLAGGSQGTTRIAFNIDIYTVPRGNLIWSMEHAGRIENASEQDYILFKIRTQMPSSPTYALVNALAYDLAQPVKKWNYGNDWSKDLPAVNKSY
jgi:hypothetical protein